MAGKDEFLPISATRLLSDGIVMSFTNEQLGAYIKLLCYDWLDDGILDSDRALCALSGLDPDDNQDQLKAIRLKFIKHPEKKACITSPELLEERKRQAQWKEKCSKGGKKSASKRLSKLQVNGKGNIDYPEEFEVIWSQRPVRDGANPKAKAFEAYNARILEGSLNKEQALLKTVEYSEWCQRRGKIGTETVMQMASFFGPKQRGFEQDWSQKPKSEGQKYDGVKPDEPLGHNDLCKKIEEQIEFSKDHLEDKEWAGAPPNMDWLNLTLGRLVLEYSERFPKGPKLASYTEQFERISEIVMNLTNPMD